MFLEFALSYHIDHLTLISLCFIFSLLYFGILNLVFQSIGDSVLVIEITSHNANFKP